MQDTTTTLVWMGGVMMIMLAYGAFAIVGFMRRKR
jgi:hypothetical protein